MKLQIEGQHLRVRIDEDELARLLSGNVIRARTGFAHAFAIGFELSLVAAEAANLAGRADLWKISLPDVAVREHVSLLPTREGLRFSLPGASIADELSLLFDVDVRDSVRRRRSS